MKGIIRKITVKTVPVFVLIVLLIIYARPQVHFFIGGLTFILIGEAFRLWAAGHLSKNREVTTTGPYAYVKNPLYIGTFLVMIGFCLLARQWVILVVGLAIFFVYYAPFKKKREADRLREIFGAVWDEYDRRVPDYIPRFSPYEKKGRHHWKWSRVVSNSEHETAIAAMTGVVILAVRLFL